MGHFKGETFVAVNKGLQDYFSDQLRTYYNFRITVVDVDGEIDSNISDVLDKCVISSKTKHTSPKPSYRLLRDLV